MKEFLAHPHSTVLTYLKTQKHLLNDSYALGTVLFISAFPVSKTELLPQRKWQHSVVFSLWNPMKKKVNKTGRVWERKPHISTEDFSGLCRIWIYKGDRDSVLDKKKSTYGDRGMWLSIEEESKLILEESKHNIKNGNENGR